MGDDALIDIEVSDLSPYPVQRLNFGPKHEFLPRFRISQALHRHLRAYHVASSRPCIVDRNAMWHVYKL